MTKMATMAINDRNLKNMFLLNFKNMFLLNQNVNDLETWYLASAIRVLDI